MPLFLGMPAFAPVTMPNMRPVAMDSLTGHLIYGLILGGGLVGLRCWEANQEEAVTPMGRAGLVLPPPRRLRRSHKLARPPAAARLVALAVVVAEAAVANDVAGLTALHQVRLRVDLAHSLKTVTAADLAASLVDAVHRANL